MGREADLVIDENPYLHRRFLELRHHDDMWWLANVGRRLTATVGDPGTSSPARLVPGAHLPVVLPQSVIRFAAGPTAYELTLHLTDVTTSVTDHAALEPMNASAALRCVASLWVKPYEFDRWRCIPPQATKYSIRGVP